VNQASNIATNFSTPVFLHFPWKLFLFFVKNEMQRRFFKIAKVFCLINAEPKNFLIFENNSTSSHHCSPGSDPINITYKNLC